MTAYGHACMLPPTPDMRLAFMLSVLFAVPTFPSRAADAPAAAPLETRALARVVLEKGLSSVDPGHYTGSLLFQSMSELAVASGDRRAVDEAVEWLGRFRDGRIVGKGSFISYQVGGTGAAFLVYRQLTSELTAQVSDGARRMQGEQPKSPEGLLMPGWAVERKQVFIDCAFAVTPFMLYAGLVENRPEYVETAIHETLGLMEILRDQKTGLVHQGRGFPVPGKISEDNWSRGNGWCAVGLAALVRDLPLSHPRRSEVEAAARAFFASVLRYQNAEGLWHQEMTDPSSYTEISGSGLLLYALGVALESGLLEPAHRERIELGLRHLPAYIGLDGSVAHTCIHCLCPGAGTKQDYKHRPWALNDPHAFGPVVLAYAQALRLGLETIQPALPRGVLADPANAPGEPRLWARYYPTGGQNVAWENERIAYRVYGPSARARVGSGIDIWAKSVPYPILEKWYRLNAAGLDYHVDRGEGADFYPTVRQRGCGGTAVWWEGKPYPASTYANQRIVRNEPSAIEIELGYEPWTVGGREIRESKRIRFIPNTQFFEVTCTFESSTGFEGLHVGVGLTTFGGPQVETDEKAGRLSVWEAMKATPSGLGTCVVVDPALWAERVTAGGDEYVLIRPTPGNQFSFTYYAGAGWEGSWWFREPSSWTDYLRSSASWDQLQALYRSASSTP